MDVALLTAIKNYYTGKDQTIFLNRCYDLLSKAGNIKGFRPNKWWSNDLCKRQLAAFYTNNSKALLGAMPSPKKSSSTWMTDDAHKYFQEHFDAPTEDSDEDYFDWIAVKIKDPEFVQVLMEKWTNYDDLSNLKMFLFRYHEDDFEQFCEHFWQIMLPLVSIMRDPERIKQYFPMPKSLAGDEEIVETEVDPEETVQNQASPEETPNDIPAQETPAENNVFADLTNRATIPLPVSLTDLALQFRENRNPVLCLQLAQALTQVGYLSCASDYYLQLTVLVRDPKDVEASVYDYVLSVARDQGFTKKLETEINAFQKDFPESEKLKTIESDLAQALEVSKDKSKRLPVFSSKRENIGYGYVDQERVFKSACAKIMAGDKLYALEFIHGTVDLLPDSVTLLRNLAQTLTSLKLTYPAGLIYDRLGELDLNPKGIIDTKCRVTECLIDDELFDEAVARIEEMQKDATIDPALIEPLYARLERVRAEAAERKNKGLETAPVFDGNAAPTPFEPMFQSPRTNSATPWNVTELHPTKSNYRPNFFNPQFPMRLMGYVKWRGNFVNFWAHHLYEKGTWYTLTESEAKTLFASVGALNLRFPNPTEPRSLKDGHPYVVVIEDRSHILPNQDFYYTVSIEPRIGQEVLPLRTEGYVVVYPSSKQFNLTANTDVDLDLGGTGDDAHPELLSNEDAVLAVNGGFAGPFSLRANANGQLYIPAVKAHELAQMHFWTPVNGDGILRAFGETKDGESASYRIALVQDKELFNESSIDLLNDEELLRITLNNLGRLATVGDIKAYLMDDESPLLSDASRRARVLALLERLPEIEHYTDEVQSAAIAAAVKSIANEVDRDTKPLTDAFVKAVAQSKNLKGLEAKLKQNEDEIRADYQARIQSAKTEFEKASRDIEKAIKARQADLTKVEVEIEKKEAFWKSEFEGFVKAAKDQITEHRLSPYFDELTGVVATNGKTISPCVEGEIDYDARAQAIVRSVPKHRLTPAELRNHIITAFQARRGYTHDEVVNLCVSLANNFLTIFAGDPGIGKTTACHVLGDVLGLSDLSSSLADSALWDADAAKRFLQVPVERGWTSKRDFLGYFNPLTQKFSSPDKRRYEAFRLLDAEAALGKDKDKVLPFIFLLDEANLSSMEYYWADFMGFCGNDDAAKREIVLGDNEVIAIPDHLRFLATINVDDTTETLSPRLLDRAWIIRLPEPKFDTVTRKGNENKAVLWSDFQAAFGCPQGKALTKVAELDPIYAEFKAAGVNVSMRSQRAIAKFVAAGESLFKGGRTTAVDYAIAQKLLPMIRASGALFHQRLEKLKGVCAQDPTTCAILDSIMTRGGNNLNFYQFF